jgi:hypothetical protein
LRPTGAKKPSRDGELTGTLERWLDGSEAAESNAFFGIECLAWCHALPKLSHVLPAAPWCELLDRLAEITREAAAIEVTEHPLEHQLLSGELPLTLSYLFPELSACRELFRPAKRQLSRGIVELLDGEGLPRARQIPLVCALLACWTRSGCLARDRGESAFDSAGRNQYVWLVRQTLRLMRDDGSTLFTEPARYAASAPLLDTALRLANDPSCLNLANRLLPGRPETPPRDTDKLPNVSLHSEWSEAAVLRQYWLRGSRQLAITYDDRSVHIELNAGGETLCAGPWDLEVSWDGAPATVSSDWEEICWTSDNDGDYLELQADLAGGLRAQRQFYLARADNFLLLADNVLAPRRGKIEYCGTLPLPSLIRYQPAAETQEGVLCRRRRLARVLPLALPEWRVAEADGSLATGPRGGLQLKRRCQGHRLYAPLFIDLETSRLRYEPTWRHLTVAEHLEKVDDDVAVGYRVHIGPRQWLVYRSLAVPGNRTLLGQNFSTEFVLARFPRSGECDKLVEIE